ncbi:MAG: formate dehydrogenase accessory sulfurtransferase FdhD [Pseudomonadales bacterium]
MRQLKSSVTKPIELETTQGAAVHPVTVWPDSEAHNDWIAEEVAVALSYNGVSHVVMMASPINLLSFAIGFSFTEGIIQKPEDIFDCEIKQTPSGIEINLSISQRCFSTLKMRQRQLSGKTGCGICGLESLQMMERNFKKIQSDTTFSHQAIQNAVDHIEGRQVLQELTGAVHAAAWCDKNGNILYIAEDVGRHNALDKLIGILLTEKELKIDQGFIFISSRVSFEMAQKTIALGAPLLVGVSAPTALALNEADKYKLAVVGFARHGRQVVYTGQQRIV